MEYVFKDNKFRAPYEHYAALYAGLDPERAAVRSGVRFDRENHVFRLRYLNRDVLLYFPELRAEYADTGETPVPAALILMARLIIEGCLTASSGRFLSYGEMPWGETYLRNFEGRCVKRLAYSFGRDLERFGRAAAAIGGTPSDAGDASYDLEFVDGLVVRVILWAADDEFPPSAQILFSGNFQHAWNAEDLAAVGDLLIDALKAAL